MESLEQFQNEAQEAGIDEGQAQQNIEDGMLWDQAIAEAKPDLPDFTTGDAIHIGELVSKAESNLFNTLTEIRLLLSQRDLVAQWDDEDGFFQKSFLPIADRYYELQTAALDLAGEKEKLSHGLSNLVEAQR